MDEGTHQPARVITGNCPECGRLMVMFNNYEVWGLFKCGCGWRGTTDAISTYHRAENL